MRLFKRKKLRCCIAAAGIGIFIVSMLGCQPFSVAENEPEQEETKESTSTDSRDSYETVVGNSVEKAESTEVVRDKDFLYENQDPTAVQVMYLTVRSGNEVEGTNHTWGEINTYSVYDYEKMGVPRYMVEGILQEGDEQGPTPDGFGYDADAPNALVQIRGQTSSKRAQKSYKIEIKKGKGTIDDQRTICLNKHVGDGLRFRNKLAYDLMSEIPQMMSLRTRFVHLYVKDETASKTTGAFEDYGLYTQVEQLNQTALKAHGLDSNGQLYKIHYFEFYRQPEVIKLQTDATYDEAALSQYIETKGNADHAKLIAMLDDLNNFQIPIETVLDKYFDMDNLTYWMAFHILIGNADTEARNLYIYSAQNSNRWYLLSWDNDACFANLEHELAGYYLEGRSWQEGISLYWGNVLFTRALKSEMFREELDIAIDDLIGTHLTWENVHDKVELYRQVTKPYAFRLPDSLHIGETSQEFDMIADNIPDLIDYYYGKYQESLEKPMPFYIGVPEVKDGKLGFVWDAAYDFDAEDIVYSFELSSDYSFTTKIVDETGLRNIMYTTDLLPEGQYFVRIKATNTSGYTQDAFDYYSTKDGKHYGMKCFYVLADGSIKEDVLIEGESRR